MRNYISIVVVALAAMFMATSCELESGTEPNPNRANQLLWNRVSDAVYQQHSHAEAVAQLNDTLIGKSYPKSVYQACELEVKDNIYTLTYNEGYYSRSYRIQTDSKLLNQGGVWVIYYRTGTYMEYVKMGTAMGIEGENAKFNLFIDNSEWGNTYYDHHYTTESEVEWEYDPIHECRLVKYNTFKGESTDSWKTPDYVIAFDLVEPMLLRSSIEQGKVHILYQDLVDYTKREVMVQIANKIVTFATPKLE